AKDNERLAKEQEAAQRRQAEAVAELLESLFGGINPWNEPGGTSGVEEQLAGRLGAIEAGLRAKYPGEPMVPVPARNALGRTYLGLGETSRALALLEAARAEARSLAGPEGPITLVTESKLAMAYLSAGRTTDAIAILERVRGPIEAELGPHHPKTLIGL